MQPALIVVDCPAAGRDGFAVGVHTGAGLEPAQVMVCAGGVPLSTKLAQGAPV
jgi:hypothetical protein